ncbi:MAG: alpha/beta hydrolase [Planctomycetota bacterium]
MTIRDSTVRFAQRVWRVFRWVLAGVLIILLLLMWFEESLVFVPSPYPVGDWRPVGLDVEDAEFAAADGTRLHGWYVRHPQPRAIVLFCHGNAGNVTHRAWMLSDLHRVAQVSALVFDYRGYGKSEGQPTEAGVIADARAARAWLAEREGIPEGEIVLMGESLGGSVAVELAATDGARALVLENTFTSVPDVAAHHYPVLPVRWLMRTRLSALSKIGRYRGPLLQVHGTADTIVPYSMGQKLFEAANEPKEFISLPGADHNDGLPNEYYVRLGEFLAALGSGDTRSATSSQ